MLYSTTRESLLSPPPWVRQPCFLKSRIAHLLGPLARAETMGAGVSSRHLGTSAPKRRLAPVPLGTALNRVFCNFDTVQA